MAWRRYKIPFFGSSVFPTKRRPLGSLGFSVGGPEKIRVQTVVDHANFFRRDPEGALDLPGRFPGRSEHPITTPDDPALHAERVKDDGVISSP